MRIAAVIYGEILAPVVRSQTFPLLRRLRALGHEILLVAVTSPRRLLRPGRFREALRVGRAAAGGRLAVLTHSPRHRSFSAVARRLGKVLLDYGPDVVHARQSRAGVVAGRAGGRPILLDLRGIRPEEYLLSLGRPEEELSAGEERELERLRKLDREARDAAAAIVVVSRSFREHLGGGEGIFVIPNAAEPVAPPAPEERSRRRRELGFSPDDTVFVYAGSLAPWQCPEETVRLVSAVGELRARVRLAILTHDLGRGKALAPAGTRVLSLTPEETRRTLPLFDLGLLLRKPSIVNRVAAPVKFAEYLHAGLPVVLTEGIGDATGLVRDHDLGVVLPDPSNPRNAEIVVESMDGFDGSRGRELARARLTFEVTARRYEEALLAAAEQRP